MTIDKEIKELEKYWNDLLYTICGKDPGRMREIAKFDVFDFYGYVENYMKD